MDTYDDIPIVWAIFQRVVDKIDDQMLEVTAIPPPNQLRDGRLELGALAADADRMAFGRNTPCERDRVDGGTSDLPRNRPIRLDEVSQLDEQVFYAFGCFFDLPEARTQLTRSRLVPFGQPAVPLPIRSPATTPAGVGSSDQRSLSSARTSTYAPFASFSTRLNKLFELAVPGTSASSSPCEVASTMA